MSRSGLGKRRTAATFIFVVFALAAWRARADVVLRDADGWSFYSRGLVATHYQLIQGDADPVSTNLLVGGRILNNVSQDENNKLTDSRLRSGFVGTQIGFGIINTISPTLQARGFLAVNVAGIDSAKGAPPADKGADIREAWGSLAGGFGAFSFGRMFSIFASASAEVVEYAFAHAAGHSCQADTSNISCGSVGAGPLYPGFNAQFRYATPRLAGFGAQVSIEDPSALPDFHITPLPRFEGELSYEHALGELGRVIIKGQGLVQKVGRLNADRDGTMFVTPWGAMGVARLELGGFKIGGGGWTGMGMGTNTPFQQDNQANPLAHDKPGGGFPGEELRASNGYFGNVVYAFRGTALAVGAGAANLRETVADAAPDSHISLIRQNAEFHAVLTQRVYSVTFSAEFMHWRSEWYGGETQSLTFAGAGSGFVW